MADDLDSILDAAGAPPAKTAAHAAAPAPDADELDAALNAAQPGASPPQEEPGTFQSLWQKTKAALGPHPLQDVGEDFADIGRGLWKAGTTASNAIVHPVDTFNAIKQNPGANFRELMRGVNSNIPFGNTLVDKLDQIREAHGGPKAPDAAADQQAAIPGLQELGGVAGAPLGSMVGGIAGKTLETAIPAASKFVQSFGRAAEERQVARGMENLEEKTYKKTRAGIRQDNVEEAVRENPELQKAVASGNDATITKAADVMRKQAGAELDKIYSSTTPMIESVTTPIDNLDSRIAALKKGTSSDAEVARHLQKIRDELNDRLGTEDALNPKKLRAEQSDFQKKGYGKAMPGDEAATARIAANREASKAVGDAVIQQVTGMDYPAAKAYAEANPDSVAARLFKANDQISAANRIDAGVADRASRAQPEHGVKAVLKRVAHHAIAPALMGATHGPMAGLATAVGQEALHAAPAVLKAGARGIDRATMAIAPRVAGAIGAIPDTALAKTISDLMSRGVPQVTAIQMAREAARQPPVPMQAPSMAANPDEQPIVL